LGPIPLILQGLFSPYLGCHRKPYRGSDRCIFHAEEKDPTKFEASFYEELERMERERTKNLTSQASSSQLQST